MSGCGSDGGWGVELIDVAQRRLRDVEEILAGARARAAGIVDDTRWQADAASAYRRRSASWEDQLARVAREVDEVRADLARTREDLIARTAWGCG